MKDFKRENSFVQMLRCRLCDGRTNSLALNQRLKPMEDNLYDTELCDECKQKTNEMAEFIAECGHRGFIKIEALERIITDKEMLEKIKSKKGFRRFK